VEGSGDQARSAARDVRAADLQEETRKRRIAKRAGGFETVVSSDPTSRRLPANIAASGASNQRCELVEEAIKYEEISSQAGRSHHPAQRVRGGAAGLLDHATIELVSDGEPEGFPPAPDSTDPFEEIVKNLEGNPDEPEQSEDPVLKRLFPDAYPTDAMSSADFRRFTERDLRAMKVAEARVVLDRLATTELGAHDLKIPSNEVESWLRTLTSVRLAVAIRLGIRDAAAADELAALPDEDPRSFMVSVYDWLGFAQETLISAL
jgi:hypothetical protein